MSAVTGLTQATVYDYLSEEAENNHADFCTTSGFLASVLAASSAVGMIVVGLAYADSINEHHHPLSGRSLAILEGSLGALLVSSLAWSIITCCGTKSLNRNPTENDPLNFMDVKNKNEIVFTKVLK